MGDQGSIGNIIDQVLRECHEREAVKNPRPTAPAVSAAVDSQDAIAKTWTWVEAPKPSSDREASGDAGPARGLNGSYSSRLWGADPRYFAEKIFGKVS